MMLSRHLDLFMTHIFDFNVNLTDTASDNSYFLTIEIYAARRFMTIRGERVASYKALSRLNRLFQYHKIIFPQITFFFELLELLTFTLPFSRCLLPSHLRQMVQSLSVLASSPYHSTPATLRLIRCLDGLST